MNLIRTISLRQALLADAVVSGATGLCSQITATISTASTNPTTSGAIQSRRKRRRRLAPEQATRPALPTGTQPLEWSSWSCTPVAPNQTSHGCRRSSRPRRAHATAREQREALPDAPMRPRAGGQ